MTSCMQAPVRRRLRSAFAPGFYPFCARFQVVRKGGSSEIPQIRTTSKCDGEVTRLAARHDAREDEMTRNTVGSG